CGLGDPRRVKFPEVPRAVLIECPQVYRHHLSKGDPNDLIKLAVGVGRYAEFFENRGAKVALVLPAEWKGQIPKEVHHARVMSALTRHEAAKLLEGCKFVADGKRHNVMDAVALAKAGFEKRLWA